MNRSSSTEPVAGYRGRLTYVSNATSSTLFGSFDTMGRVLGSTQTTGSTPFAFSYVYDLAGELTSVTYPSGRTVITAYEEAGRPAGLTGSKGGVNTAYVQAAHYGPQGAPSQIRFAGGL